MDIFRILLVLIGVSTLSGCGTRLSLLHDASLDKLSFRAMVMNQVDAETTFHCRTLFEVGTGTGSAHTSFRSSVARGAPMVMTGVLKDMESLQGELAVLGLPETACSGSGYISHRQALTMQMPLPDGNLRVTAHRTRQGIALEPLPAGMPSPLDIQLKPGESILLAYFGSGERLILLAWTLGKP